MKKAEAKKLAVGDRVELRGSFRFGKEQGPDEVRFDELIKAAGGAGTVAHPLDSDNTVLVTWEDEEEHDLWAHYECLEWEVIVTDKEVQDAIRSILEG